MCRDSFATFRVMVAHRKESGEKHECNQEMLEFHQPGLVIRSALSPIGIRMQQFLN